MRRTGIAAGAAACAMVLGTMLTGNTVLASTHYPMGQKEIVLNGTTLSKPEGLVAGCTTYMPIYYVMKALDKMAIKNHWNGNTWRITAPSWMMPDFSDIKVGTGSLSIEVNGKLIKKVNGIVAIDPASGKNTTYMPIWYVKQLIADLYVSSTWHSPTWDMETDNNLIDYQPEDQVQFVDDYLSNLNATDDYDAFVGYLYITGNITAHAADVVDGNYPGGWTDFAKKNNIQSISMSDFQVSKTTMLSVGKVEIETSETDTTTYTDGTTKSTPQLLDWTVTQDPGTGLWQVSDVQSAANSQSPAGGAGSNSTGNEADNSTGASGSTAGSNTTINQPAVMAPRPTIKSVPQTKRTR